MVRPALMVRLSLMVCVVLMVRLALMVSAALMAAPHGHAHGSGRGRGLHGCAPWLVPRCRSRRRPLRQGQAQQQPCSASSPPSHGGPAWR